MIIFEIFQEALIYILGETVAATAKGQLFVEYASYILTVWLIVVVIRFFGKVFSKIFDLFGGR